MKILFLVRHAKSSWKHADELSDVERPLNKRGERDAPFMGELLLRKGILPDMLVSSPALRALSTAKEFANTFEYLESKIEVEDRLYLASAGALLGVIQNFDNDFDSIMVFGHNPGLTEFINLFENVFIDNLPTCGVVCIAFSANNWSEAEPENGKVLWVEYPKLYAV